MGEEAPPAVQSEMQRQHFGPPVPSGFLGYLRAFGPGLIMALTWLGASDLVSSAVAGSSYGYALLWAPILAFAARFAFVNIIAKYELYNERGESLIGAMLRIHRSVPIMLLLMAVLLGHFYNAYVISGLGEATYRIVGPIGTPWMWSLAWIVAFIVLVFFGAFNTAERIFYVFLAVLSVVFIGLALWVRPSPTGILRGIFLLQIPPTSGKFGAVLVVISLIGAMAGSLQNLLYPYFMRQKGWSSPKYRRVQTYDLLFGTVAVIILDLAVWIVAAEVLHPRGMQVADMGGLANMFVLVLGQVGEPIFHAGLLAMMASSTIGLALGHGYLSQDIMHKLANGPSASLPPDAVNRSKAYQLMVLWCLISPFIWSIPGMPGFVPLSIFVNAAAVVLTPILAALVWYLTAHPRFIGEKYRNGLWGNSMMAVLFALACYATWQAITTLLIQSL